MLNQSKKKKIPILMYHSVSSSSNPKFKEFAVPPALFAEQMAYLSEQKYTPITVTQLVQARTGDGDNLPEQPVVITFDDGFADFLTDALPALQKYHFSATLYIATAYIGGTSRWLQAEGEGSRPMLTWQQVSEVDASGIECGAHTHSHPQLDTLPLPKAKDEIERSKKILEDHLGQEVSSFAYPYGYFTPHVRQLVSAAGFHSACAVRHAMSGEDDHTFSLARLMVDGEMAIDMFGALVSGQGVSTMAAMYTLYARARTPVWQLVRRNVAMVRRNFKEEQGGELVP